LFPLVSLLQLVDDDDLRMVPYRYNVDPYVSVGLVLAPIVLSLVPTAGVKVSLKKECLGLGGRRASM
jgi:hypothetical protein